MDEWTLNDLLECSVCLERLDTSSKVLPCQHTFCKKCLEEIVSTHKELRCPECRVLVDAKIDELPPNVLLMRILEGMRNAAPKKRSPGPNRIQGSSVAPAQTQQTMSPQQPMTPLTHPGFKQPQPSQPCARAIYDYIAKEPGDLSFKKGDIILLRKKIDTNWYKGEVGGCLGAFPLTYVQVITPLPNQIPQCKALYDFRMTNDDDEGCLTFNKGEVITVLRRIDENWAEGRLGDRIGIFPLAFVELNVIARALMKLSTNSQPGPSRVAPPTPTAEDTTPLIPTGVGIPLHAPPHSSPAPLPAPASAPAPTPAPTCAPTSAPAPAITTQTPSHLPVASAEPQPSSPLPPPLTTSESSSSGSSASSSSTTPNTSSSNTSSSSSTAPSSPTSPPPPPQPQSSPAHMAPAMAPTVAPTTASAPAGTVSQHHHRDKRHSFNALHSQPPAAPSPHHRHSAEILSSGGDGGGGSTTQAGDSPATSHHVSEATATGARVGGSRGGSGGAAVSPAPDLLLQRQSSKRHRRTASSGDKLSAGNTASPPPPQGAYIALYPYKPQKTDELELKKGGIYLVTERCEDGWFKGTSNRTQKCGVFPGNYVTPATNWASCTPLPGVRTVLGPRGPSSPNSLGPAPASPRQVGSGGTPPVEPRLTAYARGKPGTPSALLPFLPRQHNGVTAQHLLHAPPPELPPRAASPGQGGPADASPSPWHSAPTVTSLDPPVAAPSTTAPASAPLGRSLSAVLGPSVTSSVSAPPNTSIPTASASREKGKEKKDKAVSLMRRLTSMKKSKSPPPAAYSMDNPVFEDGSVAASPVHPTHTLHPVHVRSGSCPSQLLQALPIDASSAHHRLFGSGSQRLKHKERPNVVMANLAHFGRTGDPVPCSSSSNHRKSNSLDATNGEAIRKVNKQLVPPVRERFRCIVPYPPMSEHELELRVGDIIYVHRKREDGWYKGTQQRTGRTGLFPASFVESF